MLGISHIRAGQFKIHKRNIDIVFLTKAIVESVSIYAQEKCLHLTFKTRLKKAVIGIDDEIFERILLNLLSNAIKFTTAEKSITIELSTRKGYVCLTVKDEGVGIPKDKLELIFERFGQVNSLLTRKAEGTGLGLTLVKMLVNASGGEIFVLSELGIGSSFNVILPAKKVAETGETQEAKNTLSGSRFMQATAIEFSDIYL